MVCRIENVFYFGLHGCEKLTDAAFENVATLRNLCWLNVSGSKANDQVSSID